MSYQIFTAAQKNSAPIRAHNIVTNIGGENMSHIVKTGEKPGRGTYSCTNCHTKVTVGEYDKMPPCPSCSNNEFTES